jgi:uncharacterized protein YjbI with pentapeptide repeats
MQRIFIGILLTSAYLSSYNQLYISDVLKKTQSNSPLIASGVDFRGAGTLLKGQKFSGELSGANFAKNDTNVVPLTGTIKIPEQATDLSGSDFSNANLVSASFKGANLENAIFNGADIHWADFSQANLRGAQFKGAKNISKARFYNATMPDGSILSYGSWTDPNGSVFNAYQSKKNN